MVKSIQTVQKQRGAGIYCDSKLLDAKMCLRLKKIMKISKGKPRRNVVKFDAVLQKAENFVEGTLLGSDVELGM